MKTPEGIYGAEKLPVVKITADGRADVEDLVVKEAPLTIVLDNQELVTMLCLPANLKHLAVGYLLSEGLLKDKEEIRKVIADDQRGIVWVETREGTGIDSQILSKRLITSGCGRGASFYSLADAQVGIKTDSQFQMSAGDIFTLVDKFQHYSDLYKVTHGVHSAALCDAKNILVFADDIGRHNAIDKVIGECVIKGVPTDNCGLIFSGRISSEMLLKAARSRIPLIISVAAPTNVAIHMASDMGMTVVGMVKGKRMNIYSGAWRIVTDGR